ncbi:MAG: TauD/TfdA family dioxygenase, partial [Cytophagales bacterium]|nr:TauD/TfdA family dioxygenase [Cytophagales bacterium]
MQEHENILNGKPRLNGQGVAQELVDYDLRLANDAVRPVGTSYLDEATKMPVVLSPKVPGVNVSTWIHHNKKEIDGYLHGCGAVLFRGFAVESVEDFDRFLGAVSKNILSYSERSSPRHEVHDKIYTSTDHPSDQSIKMHTE